MTRTFSLLALSLALATQAHALDLQVPAAESLHVLAQSQTSGTATPGVVIPNWQTVLSVSQIELRITGESGPCSQQAGAWSAGGLCFDVIMPDGDVRRFNEDPHVGIENRIEGYEFAGEDVILVEHVQTANYVSCMPTGPAGCQFDHFFLIPR